MEEIIDLVQKSQKGDKESFGKLYDLYVVSIYKFIYFKTHHTETAEDLTSKTFLKALEKIKTYKPDKGSFSTWLYGIARNTVIDFYRTDKKELNIDDAWDIKDDSSILIDVDKMLDIEEIKKLLDNLSSEQRDVIVLKIWQGLSYKEIAQIMGKSEENCRVIFSRSIKELKGLNTIFALILLLKNLL